MSKRCSFAHKKLATHIEEDVSSTSSVVEAIHAFEAYKLFSKKPHHALRKGATAVNKIHRVNFTHKMEEHTQKGSRIKYSGSI